MGFVQPQRIQLFSHCLKDLSSNELWHHGLLTLIWFFVCFSWFVWGLGFFFWFLEWTFRSQNYFLLHSGVQLNISTWTLITSSVSWQQHNINNKYGISKCSAETLQKERLNWGLSAWSGFACSREMGTIKHLKDLSCINLYMQIIWKCKKITTNANYSPCFKIRLLLSICTHAMCFPGAVHKQKHIYVQMRCERQVQSYLSCISSTIWTFLLSTISFV